VPFADIQPVSRSPLPSEYSCDVLVIGAGPSGSSAAYWLAKSGLHVLCIEKKHFPREKTCGDGLTPRSVRQLYEMGLKDELGEHHRYEGLRAIAFGRELTMPWPSHPDYPGHGYVITRHDLDEMVSIHAGKAGAIFWQGAEAMAPLGDNADSGGKAEGALVADRDHGTTCEVRAKVTIVADGANSRFGRALGATRDRSIPLGMAIRGYFSSPRHADNFIESHLDIRDKDGKVVPGYGWIFPLGDGRVNVGIGLLSTFDRWKQVNTSKLMSSFVDFAPQSWCLSESTALTAPTGGRLPMGLSVGPHVGPDYLLVGDAGGSINPFNGEGIAYGYETGRLGARIVAETIELGDLGHLELFGRELERIYGLYYKVASKFMTVMGRPELMRRLVSTGMHSQSIMAWLLRIMSNLLRDDERGPAELAYKALAKLASARPSQHS
jgi:geranylgeranyl reductase family protein